MKDARKNMLRGEGNQENVTFWKLDKELLREVNSILSHSKILEYTNEQRGSFQE